jgi:hypothetical protein
MTKDLFSGFDTFEIMKFSIPFGILLTLLSIACRTDSVDMKELDLNPHGVPVTIMAPHSAEVRTKDYTIMRDITIRKGEDFFIQIFEINVPQYDAAGEKLRQLATVTQDPFFKEILREDDHGFIYSKHKDSLHVEYDFRYVKIVEDKELIFQTGLVGSFSLEAVKRMYNAVK